LADLRPEQIAHMSESWQSSLDRWMAAGVVDATTAARIRNFEATREEPKHLRWPILIAISFGALMLAAGVLLFVSAHWDELSPSGRFSLVLATVGLFHVAGAVLSERFPALSTALHGIGTAALGAGIYLAAQIFNLQEHWPGGIMLWALGAWMGWVLLRDWVQAAFAALLTPAWLASEWIDATARMNCGEEIAAQGLLILALVYLSASTANHREPVRRVLAWIGGIALIPLAIAAVPENWWGSDRRVPLHLLFLGRGLGLIVPLLLAYWLRRREAWMNVVAALWVMLLAFVAPDAKLTPYIWAALGSLGLIAWGLHEARRERINLGILGFGLTVLFFYFSNVMDKLGRSASLIGLGLLFLVLAWGLERTRRGLVAKVRSAAA
jgi:uncharacterized membrane protein